ncbi:hypothetical protein DRQ29_06560, partial [bacterium]
TVDTGTAGATITNTAEVTGDQPDPDDTNNRAAADITVQSGPAGGGGGVADECDQKVIINEVGWSGTGADQRDEWIELRNLGTSPVDLTGWILRWRKKNPTTPEERRWKVLELSGIIAPTTISACEEAETQTPSVRFVRRADGISWLVLGEPKEQDESYVTLERRHDATIINVKADMVYDTAPPYHLALDDDGDVIQLLNADGELVDTANASPEPRTGWPAGDATLHASMERTDPLGPDTPENWHTNPGIITRGLDALGRPILGTAAAMNSTTLDELALEAGIAPVVIKPGDPVEVPIEITKEARKVQGWPWIRVTQPELAMAAGGGGMLPSGYSFYSRQRNGEFELGINTSKLPPGRYNFWIVYGEGKTILVPMEILP